MVNHPNADQAPNVTGNEFDYELRNLPRHAHGLIPNELSEVSQLVLGEEWDPSRRIPGLVMLATRDLQDEELFFDYRSYY
jgi:hypothetical protein